ncbi:hypothetical protein BDZ89DRAFT_1061605 [Hymenopellis radicata]|nr:hypothetical protein BDZ89DRAFT_1061605 [Hymenopellis radicata]
MSCEDIDAPTFATDESLCREDRTVDVRVGVFDRAIVREPDIAPLFLGIRLHCGRTYGERMELC